MNGEPTHRAHGNAAALEHLTGPLRGEVTWVTGAVDVRVLPDRILSFSKARSDHADADTIARFRRAGSTYEIEATGTEPLWVNGKLVHLTPLGFGDVIEFGETGPLSRFRLYDERHRPPMTVADIFDDMICYIRTSRRPLLNKLGFAATELGRRMARETTLIFRALVVISLGVLTFFLYQQYRTDKTIRAQIESGNLQIDSVAKALTEARRETIRPSDLAALQDELGNRLTSNAERLRSLEARSGASPRVISGAASSVAFLQGAYSLRHTDSGDMLRHVLGADGLPVYLPNGQPYLALTGTGPVAEVQFNGTGFVLSGSGVLITNRHVAEPWGSGPATLMGKAGLEPAMTRFVAYFPGHAVAVPLTTIRTSDTVDLAVLSLGGDQVMTAGLHLAAADPMPGEEVIVMGYPTGLKSMLAQSGAGFVQELQKSGETGFWVVAERLAAANLIAPLASRGIIGQATGAAVVYDAETTHGGSGGPVLNMDGEVIAVNTAIIPEFGGSNFGIPVSHIISLLAEAAD